MYEDVKLMTKHQTQNFNLTKVDTLFIDYKKLARRIEDETHPQIDYRRIGVTYGDERVNLSQVMYATFESEHAGANVMSLMDDEDSYDEERKVNIYGLVRSLFTMVEVKLADG